MTSGGFVTGLALAEEPTFCNVFVMLTLTEVCQSKVTLYYYKRHPFGPFHL